ncbi:MAG: hypothetical protein OER43_15895 [Gammaproteobacteria bacterium]|nr:hypothetical protein [Gammaproteobacteria bacterium]
MSNQERFKKEFDQLRRILESYASGLSCEKDESGDYYLNTTHIMKNKKPLFFGVVQIKKNYVSYHLMPVYVYPELLESISAELKRRMQGKSCFNFTSVDSELFVELAALTKTGYEKFRSAGYA